MRVVKLKAYWLPLTSDILCWPNKHQPDLIPVYMVLISQMHTLYTFPPSPRPHPRPFTSTIDTIQSVIAYPLLPFIVLVSFVFANVSLAAFVKQWRENIIQALFIIALNICSSYTFKCHRKSPVTLYFTFMHFKRYGRGREKVKFVPENLSYSFVWILRCLVE